MYHIDGASQRCKISIFIYFQVECAVTHVGVLQVIMYSTNVGHIYTSVCQLPFLKAGKKLMLLLYEAGCINAAHRPVLDPGPAFANCTIFKID